MENLDKIGETGIQSLEQLFVRQGNLNRKCGKDTVRTGRQLVLTEGTDNRNGLHDLNLLEAGVMLHDYINAMRSETQELADCLSWKHWYTEAKDDNQFKIMDLQNARVEVIDMLFFWVSLAQTLGLTVQDVYRLYEQKLGINHKRQDENRSQAEHANHEDENRDVR